MAENPGESRGPAAIYREIAPAGRVVVKWRQSAYFSELIITNNVEAANAFTIF